MSVIARHALPCPDGTAGHALNRKLPYKTLWLQQPCLNFGLLHAVPQPYTGGSMHACHMAVEAVLVLLLLSPQAANLDVLLMLTCVHHGPQWPCQKQHILALCVAQHLDRFGLWQVGRVTNAAQAGAAHDIIMASVHFTQHHEHPLHTTS
jgi:hypothetical protein